MVNFFATFFIIDLKAIWPRNGPLKRGLVLKDARYWHVFTSKFTLSSTRTRMSIQKHGGFEERYFDL